MATIKDIAALSDASTATVDRVLNGRPGVKEATRQRVLGVAAQIGYEGFAAAYGRYDFILPKMKSAFMRELAAAIEERGSRNGGAREIVVHFVNYDEPEALAGLIARIKAGCGGLGIVAVDHLLIREALRGLLADKIPILSLITDISTLPHHGYVGIDNRQAGRLAGYMIGRFLAPKGGKVVLFTGSHAYRGHEEREMGFRHILKVEFPHLSLLETVEIYEDDDAAYAATKRLLSSHENVVAIHSVGAGSGGVARALRDCPADEKPVFVAYDLTSETRPLLIEGTIDALIDQDAETLAREALRWLDQARNSNFSHSPQGLIEPRLIVRENIPPPPPQVPAS